MYVNTQYRFTVCICLLSAFYALHVRRQQRISFLFWAKFWMVDVEKNKCIYIISHNLSVSSILSLSLLSFIFLPASLSCQEKISNVYSWFWRGGICHLLLLIWTTSRQRDQSSYIELLRLGTSQCTIYGWSPLFQIRGPGAGDEPPETLVEKRK